MKHRSLVHTVALVMMAMNISADAGTGTSTLTRTAREALLGVPAEIGPERDALEAYRRLQLEGDEFYTKHDAEIHRLHHRAYENITRAVTGDRITFEEARDLLDRLVTIGREHLAAEEDLESDAIPTIAKLEQLDTDITDAMTERADADTMSPEIDRLYWLMEAATRFAEASDMSSSSASRLRRNLDRQLADETNAKSDGVLSERERHDLLKSSLRTWAGFVYTFRNN